MIDERGLVTLLADFARNLVTDFDVQEILDEVVTRIVEILPIDSAGITLIGPQLRPEYVAASSRDAHTFERLQTELGEGPCRVAYHSGAPVMVPDLARDTSFPSFSLAAQAEGLASTYSFPLHHRDTRLGALDLYSDTPGHLDPQTIVTAQTLADVVAAYLANAQWRGKALQDVDSFRARALHDPLTGLANRVLLQERLDHATDRIPRIQTTCAILFADLDRFKEVNDTHGHEVGDQLLIAVAQRLSALVRPGDTLARISGDEFVLVCEDLNQPDEIDTIAERVRRAFVTPFIVDGLTLSMNASVGVARAAPGQPLSKRLLAEADLAMYRNKQARYRTTEPAATPPAASPPTVVSLVEADTERDVHAGPPTRQT